MLHKNDLDTIMKILLMVSTFGLLGYCMQLTCTRLHEPWPWVSLAHRSFIIGFNCLRGSNIANTQGREWKGFGWEEIEG